MHQQGFYAIQNPSDEVSLVAQVSNSIEILLAHSSYLDKKHNTVVNGILPSMHVSLMNRVL